MSVATWLRCVAIGSLMVAILPSSALAQAVPDLQDQVVQDQQINRQVQGATRPNRGAPGDETETINGEAGVYVLLLNDIFQLSASGGLGYTGNPSRTAENAGGEFFSDFAAAAGLSTRLGGTVDFGLSASISGREFLSNKGPSSRSVSAVTSVGTSVVGPLYAGIVGFGGYSYDNDFRGGTSFYGVSGNLSAALPITDRFALRPGVGATRQWSDVSENNSSSVSGSVELFYALTPRISTVVRGSVTRRWYDDFYEDVTFVERRDTSAGFSASLSWHPLQALVVGASISYETQDSRFFLAKFNALETSAVLSAQIRF